ncbi:MAG: M23 family metallopeptidase [Chloroflexota bacterium]
MTWATVTPIYLWLALAGLFSAWFWLWRPKDKLTALLLLLNYALFNLYFALNVNWAMGNYYLIALPFLLTLALIPRTLVKFRYSSLLGQKPVPFSPRESPRLHQLLLGVTLVFTLGLGWLFYGTLRSYTYRGEPVLMYLPVRIGMYVVANGGNGIDGFGMNDTIRTWYGAFKPEAKALLGYGADIYKIHALGNPRQRTTASNPLLEYAIFNDFVYMPCMGQAVYVEDGHADVPPYGNPETALGNYVVVQCEQYYVTLAHLRKNSINIAVGDFVRPLAQIAHVGNSGSPAIPHLHVHVTHGNLRSGEATPILFDGWFAVNQFPVRNKLFIP